MVLKPVFIIAIVAVVMIGVMVPSAFAETWYYYVEPLPEYASYANNVMELSTTAWEDANDDLQFIEVSSPQQANFQVQWVKEFGVEHVGYAFGSWFIEVGLGDSGCGNGMWHPYSEQYTTNIMTHEIGHVLGFDHVNDPDSIMYPTAINWEYGNVETKKTLTNGYGYFQPICTSKDVTTFDWHVSSDDPIYGFDVYFVSSVNEFDNWVDGKSFNYFDDNACFAENMLSVGGTCEGVTQDSGLLIIMGDNASEPLTEITLNLRENNFESIIDTSNSEKSVIQSEEDSSTTQSIPIPIPTPQPDVITSTGTSSLSETSVDISAGQSEQVKIYGIISNVDKSTRVSITYTYPDGTTDGGTIFTTDTGVYETYLNLDKNSPIGNYEILVTAKGKILDTLILQVNDKILDSHPFAKNEITSEVVPESIPKPIPESDKSTIASFVNQSKDPQHYIDRYNNEPTYKQWFDENYSQYSSIYEAVGLEEPLGIASFVDTSKDPQHYIDRYNNEPTYKQWFDENYSQYSSIYEAVGLEEPVSEPVAEYSPESITEVTSVSTCGIGTIEKDGICVAESKNTSKIKLIPGQWAEYDVDIEFEGSRTMIAMMDKMMKESTTDTGFDIFKITKLRVEVLEVTDTFVEIERTVTMIDDEITTIQKIDDVSGGTFFAQPFIELPHPSTLKQNLDDGNPFTIEFINLKGEKNLTVNKQKISTLFYRGYTSSHFGEDTPSKSDDLNSQTSLAEYYFEKNTGILVKSKNEITMFGIVPFLGEVDIKMTLILSMTDDYIPKEKSSKGGGCLIATATYGSEMSQQVQQLRELRDNTLLNTESGKQFMGTFNDIYYSFSPTIADMERENPYFKEAVKLAITPMISSLSLMENANSESEVLSIGLSVIALNLGMYLGVPAVVIVGIRKALF
jgi:hypothetical protein